MSEQRVPEARRRAITKAVALRPEVRVSELVRLLDNLGIQADEPTVRADLDALGLDVGDRAAVAAPAGEAEARRAGSSDATTRAIGGLGVALIVAALVVVLAIAAAALLLGDDAAEPVTVVSEPSPDANPFGSGPLGGDPAGSAPASASPSSAPAVAPVGPGPDPALTEPDIVLRFDVDSGLLPSPSEGETWTALSGDFEVVGGQAVSLPATDGTDEPSVAVFATEAPDLRAQVTLPEVIDGAGLAFRTDDTGYYAWVVSTAGSTAVLLRVTPEGSALVLNVGTVALQPGLTLGLNIVGSAVEVLANGVVVGTTEVAGGATDIGLAALSVTDAAVFDDLLVQYA